MLLLHWIFSVAICIIYTFTEPSFMCIHVHLYVCIAANVAVGIERIMMSI